MVIIKEKEVYQTPAVEVITFNLNSIIAVSPGGGEGTGDENWLPAFPPSESSLLNTLLQ